VVKRSEVYREPFPLLGLELSFESMGCRDVAKESTSSKSARLGTKSKISTWGSQNYLKFIRKGDEFRIGMKNGVQLLENIIIRAQGTKKETTLPTWGRMGEGTRRLN